MNKSFAINPKTETKKIVSFLEKTFEKQNLHNAVIGLSGGIDSTVSFYLLKEFLSPKNIYVAHLYYKESIFADMEKVLNKNHIPKENIHLLSIKKIVDTTAKLLQVETDDKVRKGNIAARTRMIVLFDLAKKYNALVTGTENKSENLLGYFTRFGDQASDIEPIEHLYKTQVYELAKYLGVPEEIIKQKPSAGLWVGQTDEAEFGFSYEEADQVLFYAFDQELSLKEIKKKGFINAEKILNWQKRNLFKHQTPYTINKEL